MAPLSHLASIIRSSYHLIRRLPAQTLSAIQKGVYAIMSMTKTTAISKKMSISKITWITTVI